jgi:anti-sigma factor RsiW
MASCWVVRRNLTAWVDGELPRRKAEGLERHLTGCAACSAEAEGLRAAIRWQRQILPRVATAAEYDSGPLHAKLQRALAAEADGRASAWRWLFRPVAIAGAVVTAVVVLFFSVMGGPKAVLIPLGVEPPPVAVTSDPDLFENYQVIQHLDALENFDNVESVPLDDDQPVHQG